jgi:hypothetical protein
LLLIEVTVQITPHDVSSNGWILISIIVLVTVIIACALGLLVRWWFVSQRRNKAANDTVRDIHSTFDIDHPHHLPSVAVINTTGTTTALDGPPSSTASAPAPSSSSPASGVPGASSNMITEKQSPCALSSGANHFINDTDMIDSVIPDHDDQVMVISPASRTRME